MVERHVQTEAVVDLQLLSPDVDEARVLAPDPLGREGQFGLATASLPARRAVLTWHTFVGVSVVHEPVRRFEWPAEQPGTTKRRPTSAKTGAKLAKNLVKARAARAAKAMSARRRRGEWARQIKLRLVAYSVQPVRRQTPGRPSPFSLSPDLRSAAVLNDVDRIRGR